jgi:simple sugar transport system permease protein
VERVSVTDQQPVDPESSTVHEVVEVPVSRRRRIGTGIVLAVVGLFCVLAFGLGSHAGYDATFGLSSIGAAHNLPDVVLPARVTAILLGALVLVLAGWQLGRGFSRRQLRWVLGVTIFCFVMAFLCWAMTGTKGTTIDFLGLLQNTIFTATPLILGALAGIMCERSGVINVAIEGQMLAGAFTGALAATVASSLGVGMVAGMVAGSLMGALLAVFAIRYVVNQVVLGVVLNVFALGLTGFLYDALMQPHADTFNNPNFFGPKQLPLLGDIPFLGPLLFDANVIVYLTYILIIAVHVGLFHTRWGLRTRAVGEHPRAADTVGINVLRTRYVNVIAAGLIAGLAGAYLTIGTIGAFSKNISSGKGFIALAAVIFGRWRPLGALGAALLFGFADALQTVLSIVGTPVSIPSSFLAMLPYLATLFAVAGLVGRGQAPAADGVPYVKG